MVLYFIGTGNGTQVVRLTGSAFALLSHRRSLHAVSYQGEGSKPKVCLPACDRECYFFALRVLAFQLFSILSSAAWMLLEPFQDCVLTNSAPRFCNLAIFLV